MNQERVYIAGPMRGIKYYGFPAFFEAEEKLQSEGYETVNPARIDVERGFDPRKLPENTDWFKTLPEDVNVNEIIMRDIGALVECDVICLLDGWQLSVGARAEASTAVWAGIRAGSLTELTGGGR